MREFFRYYTDLPKNSGFHLFDLCHWMWIFIILGLMFFITKYYINLNYDAQGKMNRLIAMLFMIGITYRNIILLITGHFTKSYLPFHLCSMALWIAVIYIFTESKYWGSVYVMLCMPGALSAILFPNWTRYPFFNYMHIHNFIAHAGLVIFGMCLLCSGRILPKWKDFWKPVVFSLFGFVILSPINKILGTNFWFLELPSKGSPMRIVMEIMGEEGYKFGIFLGFISMIAIWECMIKLCFSKKKNFGL